MLAHLAMIGGKRSLSAGITWIAAFCLILGILPSLTAASTSIAHALNGTARYLGPINPLKVGLPFLVAQLWIRREQIPRNCRRLLIAALGIGTAGTLIADWRCDFAAPVVVREWAVMVVGMLGAIAFTTLPKRQKSLVLAGWLGLVYGLAALDLILPSAIDWLYNHVFDPSTRATDLGATGHRLLTGVFGNQSMAKLLSWLPWIALTFSARARNERPFRIAWLVLATVSTSLILATSQRGPFLGALAGWLAYAVHRLARFGERKSIIVGVAAVFASMLLTVMIVPHDILEVRFKSALGVRDPARHTLVAANENIWFRQNMVKFTLASVRDNPLGDACTPRQAYLDAALYPSHSHNLFLQQYRDRGWIWGTFHLFLWFLALYYAWKSKDSGSTALVAGITCVCVQGLFDQPWFVLNHALLLSAFLYNGLRHGPPA